jgi:hypothetical protein
MDERIDDDPGRFPIESVLQRYMPHLPVD